MYHYTINHLLENAETTLGKLIEKANSLAALDQAFAMMLEGDLASQCYVSHYENGRLLLLVENASLATKLRYKVPEILSKLRSFPTWAGLGSIQIKVQKDGNALNRRLDLQAKAQQIPAPPMAPQILPAPNRAQFLSLAESFKTTQEKPGMEKLIASLERIGGQETKL